MAWPPEINPGLYFGTTQVWDVGEIQGLEGTAPELKELLVRLYQNLNNSMLALNAKDSALYAQQEFVCGQLYPPTGAPAGAAPNYPRPVFRKLIEFGALPNTAAKNVAHGLTFPPAPAPNTFVFTRIYGVASDLTGVLYMPLPYASPVLANNVELSVNATNVTVTTGTNLTSFTQTWIVLEFLKF